MRLSIVDSIADGAERAWLTTNDSCVVGAAAVVTRVENFFVDLCTSTEIGVLVVDGIDVVVVGGGVGDGVDGVEDVDETVTVTNGNGVLTKSRL